MTISHKIKIRIIIIVALVAMAVVLIGYYKKTIDTDISVPVTNEENIIDGESLVNDEIYVQEKTAYYLNRNPKASEEYAIDIVFHDIAEKEQNPEICEKIKDEYWRSHCHRLIKPKNE